MAPALKFTGNDDSLGHVWSQLLVQKSWTGARMAPAPMPSRLVHLLPSHIWSGARMAPAMTFTGNDDGLGHVWSQPLVQHSWTGARMAPAPKCPRGLFICFPHTTGLVYVWLQP